MSKETTGEKTTILNVDDNPANLYVRSRVLRGAGYAVIEAATGTDALRLAAELKPALVLLDVNLPDISGLEVCRRIKTDPSLESVFVLQISAMLVEPKDKALALEGGADSYLTDPLEPAELLATVRALLRLQQTEQKLRESEERLRLAAQTSGFGFHDYDIERGIFYWSPELYNLSGVSDDVVITLELIGEMIHPNDRDRVLEKMRGAFDPQGTGEFAEEFCVIRPDTGETRWLYNRSQMYFTGEGAGRRAVRNTGIIFDITDRKLAEERIIRSETNLRLATGAARMYSWEFDLEKQVTSFSNNFSQVVGLPEMISEMKTSETYEKLIYPDDREKVALYLERSIAGKTDLPPLETRLTIPDQNNNAVVWLEVTCYTVLDERGKPVRVVGVSQNITQRKQREKELRQTNAVLTAINLNTPTLIYVKDRESRILSANPATCAVIGKPLQEIIGKNHTEYMNDAAESAMIRANDLRIIESGKTETFEETVETEAGEIVFLSTKTPYRDENGEIIGLIGVSVDITERKHAETECQKLFEEAESARREAESANRAKDEFLALLSHELRSPLNSMLGWTQILESSDFNREIAEKAMSVISRNVRLQKTLIEDLLDVSRIISGKMQLDTETVSLAAIVQESLDAARPIAEKRAVKIESQFDANPGEMSGDRHRLQQIVSNLLTNAIKFTPENGAVKVTLERTAGNCARLTVSDTGIGIEPEVLPHIFDRFRQADASSKRKFGGLGLGLAIVRHLTEMHGGTVSAHSEGEGRGATFTVLLPLLETGVSRADLEFAPKKTGANGDQAEKMLAGLRILLVDDDRDSLDLVCFALDSNGATTVCADSANEALQILSEQKFDLLISDLGMAEMDGYDLIEKVRERGVFKLPAIALTGYVSAEDRERVRQAGFQEHLAKPIDLEMLPSLILTLLTEAEQESKAV